MRVTNDFLFAVRSLRKSPGFLAVAALSLGLGIALNTTIFGLVHSMLFRMPEVEAPEQLVDVYTLHAGETEWSRSSVLDYLDLEEQSTSFEGIAAHSWAILNVRADTGRPRPLLGAVVSHDYFDVLGVNPSLGRGFLPEERAGSGAPPTAVLTDAYWRRRFDGDPKALEKTLTIGGESFDIVGVLPPGFRGLTRGLEPDVFVPLSQMDHIEPMGQISATGNRGDLSLADWRGYRFLILVGRLAEGTDLAAARSELQTLSAALAIEYPDTNEDRTARLIPTSSVRFDPTIDRVIVPAAMIVLALVGMVLLVACANIGNMLLAKAEGRRREIAVRLSLGAGRWQLVRMLLIESLVLSIIAGAAGLALATVAMQALTRVRFDLPIEIALSPRLDPPVLLFTLAISLATGLFFGLIPALQASRQSLVADLRAVGAQSGRGLRGLLQPARLLVVAQVALSLVLLVGAGLLQRSVGEARAVELGYDADRLGTINIDLTQENLGEEAIDARWRELTRTVSEHQAVVAAGVATRMPLELNLHTTNLLIPGHREREDDPPLRVDMTYAANDFFETLGLELEQGAWFPPSPDGTSDRRLAIVNHTMADRFWPEGAVGETFRRNTLDSPEITIVGVVEDYKVRTPGEEPRAMLHLDRAGVGSGGTVAGSILYRTQGTARDAEAGIADALLAAHPDLFVLESTTLDRRRDLVLMPIRLGGVLVSGLGLLALVLAVVGLAGLIAYWVSQRTKEIGIRTALGADRGRIATLVLRRSLTLVGVGSVLGMAGALVLGRLLETALYVPAADPVSMLLGVTVLAGAAAIATLVPIRRATRVDTWKALRAD